jgi:hypothetical protein
MKAYLIALLVTVYFIGFACTLVSAQGFFIAPTRKMKLNFLKLALIWPKLAIVILWLNYRSRNDE